MTLAAIARFEVSGLACLRGGRRVFAGLGFEVAAGGTALVRGPNGAGKSSLLRVLAGLGPAEAGDAALVLADGARVALSAGRDAYLERIAYVGHLDALKPSLSVHENLAFWARFLGAAPAGREDVEPRVRRALERFALDGIAEAPAGLCSAGQKRRLGLARLAVVDRPVWLLDEPTVSLDQASVEAFGTMVSEHCAAGGIAVAATHIALPVAAATEVDMGAAAAPGAAPEGAGATADDPFLVGGAW